MHERNPPPQLRNTNTLFDFPEIPEEILFDEILARLPVKSLSRFKCVSKPWRTLIESDRFIKIHYRYSAKNPIVLLSNLYSKGRLRCSLQWLLKESKQGTDPTKNEPKEGFLLGFCNGVVCNYDRRRFWLRNPATRVSVELPRHNDGGGLSGPLKYGFGWDESTGAYKVFALLFDYKNINQKKAIVYSSNTNSWRTIFLLPGIGSSLGGYERGLFLRRNLHWIDERHYQIECFDLGREEFGRIELPFVSSINAWLWLGDIGGSLGVLIYLKKSLEVWVMKEYGVKDSWLKFLTFPPTSLPKHMEYVYCPLFGEAPSGETFLIYGETFIIYNPKDDAFSTDTNKVRFISTDTNIVRFIEALVYVESLVSPETILCAASTNSR